MHSVLRYLSSKYLVVGILSFVIGTANGATAVREPVNVSVFAQATVNLMDWVAKDKGFFEKRGLDVSIVQFTSGPAQLAAALSGATDIFNTGPALTIPANQRGACVKYVTAGEMNVINIIAQKDLSLPNRDAPFPKPLIDLKGKTIGVIARGSVVESMLKRVLRQAGLDPDRDVTFVAVGGSATSVAAFKAKRVDALLTFAPTEQLLEGNYAMVAHLTAMENSPVRDGMIGANATTCKFLQEHPNRVLNYCKAIWDAYDFMNDPKNDAEVARIYARSSGLPDSVGAAVWQDVKSTFPVPPILTDARWKDQAEYFNPPIAKMPALKDSIVAACVSSDPRK